MFANRVMLVGDLNIFRTRLVSCGAWALRFLSELFATLVFLVFLLGCAVRFKELLAKMGHLFKTTLKVIHPPFRRVQDG